MYYTANSNRNIYIPEKFRMYIQDRPFKEFTGQMLAQHDKAYRHLYKGGVILVYGNWEKIKQLYEYIVRKQRDILRGKNRDTSRDKKSRKNKQVDSVQVNHMRYRFALCAQRDTLLADPPQHIPYLFNFAGENNDKNKEECYYIPLYEFLKIKDSLKKQYNIHALQTSLTSHYTVLPPASQKIYTLFQTTLESLLPSMPCDLTVLDMGCGSGILAFIAVYVFGHQLKRIDVTDILPEALASCNYNIDNLNTKNVIDTKKITVLHGGDLFTGIDPGSNYDCILFNPPWTIQRKWSKENKATADYEFVILNAFLSNAGNFLGTHGTILLFYSDHSGQKVMDTVEELIKKYGYTIQNRVKEKIRAKGKVKKWDKCFIYQLTLSEIPAAAP